MDDNENERSQDVDWRCGRKMNRRAANRKRDQEQATDREWIKTDRGWIEDGKVLVWQVVDGGVGYRGRRPPFPRCTSNLDAYLAATLFTPSPWRIAIATAASKNPSGGTLQSALY